MSKFVTTASDNIPLSANQTHTMAGLCAGHKLVAPVAIESLYQLAFVIHSHHSLHNLSCCFCCFYCCLQVIQMWSPC